MPNMYVSKIDAAKRQLDIAIDLFFKNRDPISIHTLTGAAYGILVDIAKLESVAVIIKDGPMIKEEYREIYNKTLNRAQNFFKHANNDPKEILEFNPEETSFLLWDAVRIYMELTSEKPSNMIAFTTWFYFKNPSIVADEEWKKRYEFLKVHLDPLNRAKFIELINTLDKSK